VDCVVTATIARSREPAIIRHHAGHMRIDATIKGISGAVLIDLRRNEGTVLATILGNKVAMPIDPAQAPVVLPQRPVSAKRIGRDRVAGEHCAVWTFVNPMSKRTDSACVTADGITVRLVVDGRTEMKATRVSRRRQDSSWFAIPPGYRRMPLMLPGLPFKK